MAQPIQLRVPGSDPDPGSTTLLINPPLWNAYAPHLAIPLLAGVLRDHGLAVRSHDASIAVLDWILSREGQQALAPRLTKTADQRLSAKAILVHPHVLASIDEAKTVIRDAATLADAQRHTWARTVMRNAMWCASAAFEDFSFDLVANQLYYAATSTDAVLAATDDPERNLYCWAQERMLPESILSAPEIGVVGLSISADTQLIAAMTMARRIRRLRPDIKIICGGNYTTRMVQAWQVRHPFFDLVDAFVLAEGEEALPSLVRAFHAGENGAGIAGVMVAGDDGNVNHTAPRPVKLDSVAPPDFSEMPLDRYFAPGPILPLYASRSCAWSCAFCSIPFASNNFRRRPGATTVDHMEALNAQYGARHFMFVDEIMTLNVLREVATEIVRRGMDIYWYGETRFAAGFDQELADLLYASGCRRLNFGLESYNQRVLDLMRKGTKLRHIDDTIEYMLAAGVPPHLFVIHGFPGETKDEAQRTITYAKSVIDRARHHFGNPYATWGGAPFVLDIHSPIGQHPDEFGISILDPPDGHDLALARDYTVNGGGLDRTESELLARQARDDTVIERNVWFRSHTRIALSEVEEFTFLRACAQAPLAQTRRVAIVARPVRDSDRLTISGTCTMMPWAADPSGDEAALVLYNGDLDTFVQLNWPHAKDETILRSMPSARVVAEFFAQHSIQWGGVTGRELVALLVRHGLLRTERNETVLSPNPLFVAEPAVLETTDPTGYVILHHPTNGNTVRIGTIGQVVWLSCSLEPTARSQVSAWFPVSDPARTMLAQSTFDDLAELGFLYVDTAVDRTAEVDNRAAAGVQ
ncbi:B12-binding domain-containing radical SAM protein [Rhodococcus sp. IEGM1428]|uniref:B12-binding domain-containing radical SAM protein n=1 Tax=Rhodococcus sp. IEGM1428 TaxID=3392191 RepID=UPI003D124AC9